MFDEWRRVAGMTGQMLCYDYVEGGMSLTVVIPTVLEEQLQALANREGCGVDALIEQALRSYLQYAAITDLTSEEVAAGQEKLFAEMTHMEPWTEEPNDDAAQ